MSQDVGGTDHKPLLGLLSNKPLDAIDKPRLVNLKQKTLGWLFNIPYIHGKMLGGSDTLSRYGLRHCAYEHIQNMIYDEDFHGSKHLNSLLTTADSDEEPSEPLFLNQDTDIINSMSPICKLSHGRKSSLPQAGTCTMYTMYVIVLRNLGSSFPAIKAELPVEIKPYWMCRGGLSVYDGVLMYNDSPDPTLPQNQGPPNVSLSSPRSVRDDHKSQADGLLAGVSSDIRDIRSICGSPRDHDK